MRALLKSLLTIIIAVGLVRPAPGATPCTGNIVIGEGDTKVATDITNKAVNGGCITDLIIDTLAEGANYANHGEFVSQVAKLARGWVKGGKITVKEAGELMSAA